MKRLLLSLSTVLLVFVNLVAQPPSFDNWYETHVRVVEGYGEVLGTEVAGATPMTFEWRKDGILIPDATSHYYMIDAVTLEDEGIYTLTATNSEGSITSEPIFLDVSENRPPTAYIRDPIPGKTFTPGEEFAFFGEGSDPDPFSGARHTWVITYHSNGNVSPGPALANLESNGESYSAGYSYIPEPQDLDLTPTSFFRIRLITNDHQGLTAKDSIDVSWSGQYYLPEPYILEEPKNATVEEGSSVTFTVNAKSVSDYQWKFNDIDIPGATQSSYQIASVTPGDAGTYSVEVSNTNATITSYLAQLTVTQKNDNESPSAEIQEPISSKTFTPGEEFAFSGEGRDPGAFTSVSHTWEITYYSNGNVTSIPIAYQEWTGEATSAGYFYVPETQNVNPTPASFIRIKLITRDFEGLTGKDSIDVSWSGQYYLPEPYILEEPQSATVGEGSPVTFTVDARSVSGYQWRFNGVDIPGATQSSYQIASVTPGDAGTYTVLVSNTNAGITSYPATLTVTPSQNTPQSYIVVKTNPANLFVKVNGDVVKTRYSVQGDPGNVKTVAPVTPQTLNGVTYAFSNWAHGGTPEQSFTTQATPTYYTMNYSSPLVGKWRTTDVGAVNLSGDASYNSGTFTLTGSGNDIWGTADAFRFIYQSVTGDVDIRAKVTSLTNTHPWAKAGVMIRNSTDRSSKHAMTVISPSNGVSFQRRAASGGTSEAIVSSGAIPYWVRVVRVGNTFTAYTSEDGSSWTAVGSPVSISMNDRVYVGLVATSHQSNTLATAVITDVTVSLPTSASSMAGTAILYEDAPDQFSVYPNPVEGNTVRVKLPEASSAGTLEIINVLGQVVYRMPIEEGRIGRDVEVDVTGFTQGVYVTRFRDVSKVKTKALIRR